MPYAGPNDKDLPGWLKRLPTAKRKQWVAVWNDEYQSCLDDGGAARKCESGAFKAASGAIREVHAGVNIGEAATLKTRAQALMRDMTSILALRDVPAAVRKEIEDVRRIFKRTWADLADEAGQDGEEESEMELGKIARVRGDARALVDMIREATTKTIDGVAHPASSFLVVEDPDSPSTWHLPVKGPDGAPDHGRMGQAWAALTNPRGSRGNPYEGPNRAEALRKLRALYRSEEMPEPAGEAMQEMWDEGPVMPWNMNALTLADLRDQRAAYEMRETAEKLFCDFRQVADAIWMSQEVEDKGAAIVGLARELAGDLRNLQNLAAETAATEEHSSVSLEETDTSGGDPISDGEDEPVAGDEPAESGQEDDMTGENVQEVRETIEEQEVTIENETERLCESSDGAEVLSLGALAEAEDGRGPLTVKVKLIRPGAGNASDRHYYPAAMLRRDAGRFAGAKMYETDHKDAEKNTRTWVSTIRRVDEFDEDGAPLAEVVVHDPSFAERLRNLSQAAMLGKMECSILASGRVKEGDIDGESYRIVEGIETVSSVDWVTRAGAGGQALELAESEPGEGGEPATEPATEQEPETMAAEAVRAWLDEKANLPGAVVELLAEREYADETALEQAVREMGEALARQFGSGRVTDNGPTAPAPVLSESERRAKFEEGVAAVNKKYLGR